MNKFMNKFMEIAGIIGAQRHLVAIRDGFVAIMPLIIIGSFAVLLNNFPPFGSFKLVEFLNGIFGDGNWQQVNGSIWNGTFAIIGLLTSFTIAYNLAKSYGTDALATGLLSLATYIIFAPETPDWGIAIGWLGAEGLFVAIIFSIIVTELFRLLTSFDKLTVKMPEGVPEGVAKSFASLFPGMIILALIGLVQALINIFLDTSIFQIVFDVIQAPLQNIGDTLPAALVVAFSNHFLWFFGLHGTNILAGIIEPIYIPLINENIEAFKAGISAFDVPNIVTKPFFDSFVYMGGSGTTIALIAAIFVGLRAKKKSQYKAVAKLATPAGLFNINEPIIFGLPIVLNPMFFIPFILGPVIITLTSYFAISWGLVPKTVVFVPWTTPPILSGYLVTGGDIRGVVLQLINLGITFALYLPFVLAGSRSLEKQIAKKLAE